MTEIGSVCSRLTGQRPGFPLTQRAVITERFQTDVASCVGAGRKKRGSMDCRGDRGSSFQVSKGKSLNQRRRGECRGVNGEILELSFQG